MKLRMLVVVVLVLAMVVGTFSAAQAKIALQPDPDVRWTVGNIHVNAWISSTYHSNHVSNIWGQITIRNDGMKRAEVACSESVFEGPQLVGIDMQIGVIPRGGWRTSHWYVEGGFYHGKMHGYYHCTVTRKS